MKFKKIIIILIAQYFLYPFYLDAVSNSIQQVFTFGLMFLYAILHFNFFKSMTTYLFKHNHSLLVSTLLYSVIFASTILIPILYGTGEFSLTYVHTRYLVYSLMYIILIGMIFIELRPKNVFNEIASIFVTSTRNYVLVSVVMILIPKIRDLWISIIHLQPRTLELINHPSYLTRVGWTGYSGFSITVYCTVAAIFSLYLITEYLKTHNKLPVGMIINLGVILLGNSFYGRAGLLVSLLAFFLTMLYITIKFKKAKYIVIFLLLAILMFGIVLALKEFIPTLENWYNWMIQPFRSILETGSIQTSSTDTLWEMWFVPRWETVLFGNGFYTSPLPFSNYYMSTDVGYLRSILFFGLFLSIVFYMIPVLLLSPFYNRKAHSNGMIFSIIMLVSIAIFEVKAETVLMLLPVLIMIVVAKCSFFNKLLGGQYE